MKGAAGSRAEVRRRIATRSERPPAPGSVRLSVVLPAYREARIGDTVRAVRGALEDLRGDLEIIVVDDGSGDGTADVARAAGADVVVEFPANRGKGAAVRAGVLAASGRTIAFTDADLSYPPAQIASMLGAVEDGWDVVVGNRHHADTTTVVGPSVLRSLGGRLINAATRVVLAGGHQDTQGGLKAFRGDLAKILFEHLRTDGFAFDVEVLFLAEQAGLSIHEVPVTVENSERSTVHVARDAVRLLGDLLAIRRTAAAGGYDGAIASLGRVEAGDQHGTTGDQG